MIIMVLYLQVNVLLKLFNEFFQVDKEREKEKIGKVCYYSRLRDWLSIQKYFLSLLDNDRQRWQRIYVEGPATGTLGRSFVLSKQRKSCFIYFSKRNFWFDNQYSWCRIWWK